MFGKILNANILNSTLQVFLQPTGKTSYLRHVKSLNKYSYEVQQQLLDIFFILVCSKNTKQVTTSEPVIFQARLNCNRHLRSTTQNRTEETKDYKYGKHEKRERVSSWQIN
jgi:tRNA A22 N-methylase